MITWKKNVFLKKSRDILKKSLTRFYKGRSIKRKIRHFVTRKKIKIFRRPKISFFGKFSHQVIVSGCKIDNIRPLKSAHPAMYDSLIHIDFPRSSLRTNKQTNKQKDMLILLIYTREVTRVYLRGNSKHALDATAGII